MCGIVGYIGKDQAAPILLEGLSKLEYRGYDSAGIAVYNDGRINMIKTKGKIKNLALMCHDGKDIKGTVGIGHTRWATHGEPSDINSHPHMNADESISLVHNGIIENYAVLKTRLEKKGYEFKSETDTEVAVHLLTELYKEDMLKAIAEASTKLEGSYAFGIISKDYPDDLFAIKKDSPLIVGISPEGNFIASDIPAVLKYTRRVYIVEDGEIVHLTRSGVKFYNTELEPVEKEITVIDWDVSAAEKCGYEHFMMKEMHEQPKAVRDTISPRIKDGKICIHELRMTEEEIKSIKRINMVACGSASYVCQMGRYAIEELARIPVDVDVASEFRYRDPIIEAGTLTIVVSQSGETADTKEAMKEAKRRGSRTLGIVNVVGSTIAREADDVFYTWAGPEIAVATTKGYTAQVTAIYMIALYFARIRGTISDDKYYGLLAELMTLPERIETILSDYENIQYMANRYIGLNDVFFIGRGSDYAATLEASLKLKEISYVHSEAYQGGELKHGTISLIEKGTLVVAIATQERLYPKTVSNIVECKSRGAFIIAITNDETGEIGEHADCIFKVPKMSNVFNGLLTVIPAQLFAYYVAVAKGCDVDQPRNLAKSVTVE